MALCCLSRPTSARMRSVSKLCFVICMYWKRTGSAAWWTGSFHRPYIAPRIPMGAPTRFVSFRIVAFPFCLIWFRSVSNVFRFGFEFHFVSCVFEFFLYFVSSGFAFWGGLGRGGSSCVAECQCCWFVFRMATWEHYSVRPARGLRMPQLHGCLASLRYLGEVR